MIGKLENLVRRSGDDSLPRQHGRVRTVLRWIGRISLGVLSVVLALGLIGTSYEHIAALDDDEAFPPPGELVNVGGFRMHIQCAGDASPTVVLESGFGGTSLSWLEVQSEISKVTRVCVYDRAGLGWSEPSPHERTARNIATELHTLLERAGIEGPYVLAGASLGGKYVRMFAQLYPDDVTGLVFLDARHEYFDEHVASSYRGMENIMIPWMSRVYWLAGRTGYARAFGLPGVGHGAVSAKLQDAENVLTVRPTAIRTAREEFFLQWTDGVDVARESLGDKPVIVLAAGKGGMKTTGWVEAQRIMASLSTNGELIVLEESGHAIQHDDPEAVLAAVTAIVEAAR
jgi:pimeloyl-ACP methyl ester carboxylesterase